MNCKIEMVYSTSPSSDAEINIVIVTIICPQGTTHTIRAYREEASELRKYVRLLKLSE
jgi:hypothetical protein